MGRALDFYATMGEGCVPRRPVPQCLATLALCAATLLCPNASFTCTLCPALCAEHPLRIARGARCEQSLTQSARLLFGSAPDPCRGHDPGQHGQPPGPPHLPAGGAAAAATATLHSRGGGSRRRGSRRRPRSRWQPSQPRAVKHARKQSAPRSSQLLAPTDTQMTSLHHVHLAMTCPCSLDASV